MSDVLCLYYSRTGYTRRAMTHIAQELDAEIVAISDDVDREGFDGYVRSGLDAMRRTTHPLRPFETAKPIEEYRLVIIGTPIWAGRCSSPIRGLLKRRGLEMKRVAYVVTRDEKRKGDEVYAQMDRYTAEKHLLDVSLYPEDEGYTFWRDHFIGECRRYLESNDVG